MDNMTTEESYNATIRELRAGLVAAESRADAAEEEVALSELLKTEALRQAETEAERASAAERVIEAVGEWANHAAGLYAFEYRHSAERVRAILATYKDKK